MSPRQLLQLIAKCVNLVEDVDDIEAVQMTADVNGIVFVTLAATGIAVGFLHAVIPTHWLPFGFSVCWEFW